MEIAKIIESNGRQEVYLPRRFQLKSCEAAVQKLGDALLLKPKPSLGLSFMDEGDGFTDDIFEAGRDQGFQTERDVF